MSTFYIAVPNHHENEVEGALPLSRVQLQISSILSQADAGLPPFTLEFIFVELLLLVQRWRSDPRILYQKLRKLDHLVIFSIVALHTALNATV
jgi:hypothetical protein